MQKWGENIFKPTIGNKGLHQNSNDNGVIIVNFATSKNLVVKSTMFLHQNKSWVSWRLGNSIRLRSPTGL
jgi:hypothetical protein